MGGFSDHLPIYVDFFFKKKRQVIIRLFKYAEMNVAVRSRFSLKVFVVCKVILLAMFQNKQSIWF